MLPTLNIIGAGKLGQMLGKRFVSYSCVTLQGICNQSLSSAHRAVRAIGQGQPFATIADLPPAAITTHRHVDMGGERSDPRSFDWSALQRRLASLGDL